MRDDDGYAVEAVVDGYELKGDEAVNSLKNNSLPVVKVEFFNSLEDEPQRVVGFLLELINNSSGK